MSKCLPFFPSLNTKGFLQVEPMTSIDNETKYVQGREKEALLFPKKPKDYSKLFNYTTSDGRYFNKPIG